MLIKGIIFVLALFQQPPTGNCTHQRTTAESEQCLQAELAREDSLLAAREEHLRKLLSARAVKRFNSAAITWRHYRDEECRGVYEANSQGTIASSALLGCKLELAKQRRLAVSKIYFAE
jgi:uncharacterized protein YecT (DUF1311 family)